MLLNQGLHIVPVWENQSKLDPILRFRGIWGPFEQDQILSAIHARSLLLPFH